MRAAALRSLAGVAGELGPKSQLSATIKDGIEPLLVPGQSADSLVLAVKVAQGILPREGLSVDAIGELLRSREGPACHQQALDAGVHQMQCRQFAHLSCAQHQGRGARQVTEYLLGQFHCSKTHRNADTDLTQFFNYKTILQVSKSKSAILFRNIDPEQSHISQNL